MVEVSREVPLAVVTVGKQSKSLSPSLSCCSGPRNVGQPSELVAQQQQQQQQQQSQRSRNGRVGDGREGFSWRCSNGPWLCSLRFLSLSLGLEYSGQICGMSQFETRFSSRGGVWFAVDTPGWSW
jgi:hypothetical protein